MIKYFSEVSFERKSEILLWSINGGTNYWNNDNKYAYFDTLEVDKIIFVASKHRQKIEYTTEQHSTS